MVLPLFHTTRVKSRCAILINPQIVNAVAVSHQKNVAKRLPLLLAHYLLPDCLRCSYSATNEVGLAMTIVSFHRFGLAAPLARQQWLAVGEGPGCEKLRAAGIAD